MAFPSLYTKPSEGALPLYTITGYTATLPSGEPVVANYANIAALLAAVIPTYSGQQCQIAGYPALTEVSRMVADWDGVSAFYWRFA